MRTGRRVPQVLWRIFRDRARTLADAVIYLTLQVTPDDCRCEGRMCLACSKNVLVFLVRPDDPPDYREFLLHCFVVIADNAPPASGFDVTNRWSQKMCNLYGERGRWEEEYLMIVPFVVESIMRDHFSPHNEICRGFDKWSRMSPVTELLTTPPWDLLLSRVGDGLMIYLLKYGSIFLYDESRSHVQLTGPPIADHVTNSPSWDLRKDMKLDRRLMLYGSGCSPSPFPRTHLLYSLKANLVGANVLLQQIFGLCEPSFHCRCCVDQQCMYHLLLKFLKTLIRKSRYCQHQRLLDKHCRVDESDGNKLYSGKRHVVAFIWAVCRSMIPSELLGNVGNWRILRGNIARFIRLRIYEDFCVRQCMQGMTPSGFPILMSSNRKTGWRLMNSWVFWLFSNIVVPLVRNNFYVTESEHGRKKVFYYQRVVWEKLEHEAAASLTARNQFSQLHQDAVPSIIRNREFGFSRLRFRPKNDGLRVLANLSAPSTLKHCHFDSVNSVLTDTRYVLSTALREDPERLGCSVFDYNGVCRKLLPFLSSLKHRGGGVFIVVADVTNAFDSVDCDMLLRIMKDVLRKDAVTFSHFSLLDEHVRRNVVKLEKKFYVQNVGIPQGSGVSSLLCSYYYGHMENNVILPFLKRVEELDNLSSESESGGCLLLRFIDDFLFISGSRRQAESFLRRARMGFAKYNCHMNEKKFSFNFSTGENDRENVRIGADGLSFIPWSGLLINCQTLEIQADYSRYLNNHLRSTLTVFRDARPSGRRLGAMLRAFMRPKCHAVFYDSNINSRAVVRLNVYQNFVLSAMKFHCYVREMSDWLTAEPRACIIMESLGYMERMIRRRVSSLTATACELDVGEVVWLGLRAFISVLTKKQSRHKGLLRVLTSRLSSHVLPCGVSPPLQYAVDPSHSSVLWSIRF